MTALDNRYINEYHYKVDSLWCKFVYGLADIPYVDIPPVISIQISIYTTKQKQWSNEWPENSTFSWIQTIQLCRDKSRQLKAVHTK